MGMSPHCRHLLLTNQQMYTQLLLVQLALKLLKDAQTWSSHSKQASP
jgi:hypothetical protein